MSSIIKAHTLGLDSPQAIGTARIAVQAELPMEAPTPAPAPRQTPGKRPAVQLLRNARQQAAALIAAAQAEAASLKEQARASGYAEGLQAGREQGLREGAAEGVAVGWSKGVEQAQATYRAAQDVLAAAEDERNRALADLQGQVIELAMAVAEKIVLKEIELDEEYLARLINHALSQVASAGWVVARVKPASVQQMRRAEEMAQELAGKLQVVEDDKLSPGDCVIETEAGILDGRLDKRLSGIRQVLEEAVGS